MSKQKQLTIKCHFNEEGYSIQEIVEQNFHFYFQKEFTKIKEQYE